MTDLQQVLDEIAAEAASVEDRGVVAQYIPELAKVDPKQLGIAITTVDGTTYRAGDAETAFSVQSISKVFMLTLALGKVGETIWRRVGREPSGSAFNSIIQLEHEHGIPRNPFINAGAIVVSDIVLAGHRPRVLLPRGSCGTAPRRCRSSRPASARLRIAAADFRAISPRGSCGAAPRRCRSSRPASARPRIAAADFRAIPAPQVPRSRGDRDR